MGFVEKEYKIKLFLKNVIYLLNDDACNFIFMEKRVSENQKEKEFTNESTLNYLEYDREDAKKEIISLTVEEYVESVEDNNPNFNNDSFKVFVKNIKDINVYIKIKIRDIENKIVVCVSFHKAEYEVTYPYK